MTDKTPRQKPEIMQQRTVAQTKIFKVEELSLEFSNGQKNVAL